MAHDKAKNPYDAKRYVCMKACVVRRYDEIGLPVIWDKGNLIEAGMLWTRYSRTSRTVFGRPMIKLENREYGRCFEIPENMLNKYFSEI